MKIQERYDVERTLKTGYPNGDPEYPHCPICGFECETTFYNLEGEILGCDNCVSMKDAWKEAKCFHRKEY